MREILFRGKRKDNGEWVEGCLHFQWGDTTNDGRATKDAYILGMRGEVAEVDPETVGQYTGLTDKNGKKIFEGDIVESQYTQKPYLVCFGEYTNTDGYDDEQEVCGWYNQEINGCITEFGGPERWASVIGKIHDNPELIGGKDVRRIL